MKKIILLFTVFALATVAFAQPTDSRFDADLKRLNRRFENVETIKRASVDKNTEIRIERAIKSAENELGRFKKKYPEYDVSRFERDLENFKNPNTASETGTDDPEAKESASTSSFAKVEDFVEVIEMILDFRPDTRKFIQNNPEATTDSKKQLADFTDKMDELLTPEFLEIAKDQTNRKIKRITDKASRESKTLNNSLSQVDVKSIKDETQENLMLSKYFNVLFSQEKLNPLKKIFKTDSNIETANQTAVGLLAKLGTIDEIEEQGKANYAAKVAANRMFPERQKNQALKDQAIQAFKASPFRRNDISENSAVLKVHLVSSGWSVERNNLTGIILSRNQQAQVAFQANDGKCYAYLMLIEQKHTGGGKYSRVYDRSGSQSEIQCANVPK